MTSRIFYRKTLQKPLPLYISRRPPRPFVFFHHNNSSALSLSVDCFVATFTASTSCKDCCIVFYFVPSASKGEFPLVFFYLVKDKDARVLQHGARDGNPLSLAAGKLHPPFSDKRRKPDVGCGEKNR